MSEIKTNDRFDKLTNRDIKTHYRDREYYFFRKNFISALAYWIIQQSPYEYIAVCKQLGAYNDFLKKTLPRKSTPYKFTYQEVSNLVSQDVFESIPEIEILNHKKRDGFAQDYPNDPDYDFIDLGALARNVFYMLLREDITQ